MKTEKWFENYIKELLETDVQEIVDIESPDMVSTFEDVGMMTNNKGLVVVFEDGNEFQLKILKSKHS